MKTLFLISILFLLQGCASNSKVVAMGENKYLITKEASTGFHGTGTMKADAIGEAGEYCAKKNHSVNVIEAKQNEGPYVMGKYPQAEVVFECK